MRLRWTEPAVDDLTGLCDYIAERDGTAAARRVALKICNGLDSLTDFPRKGRPGRISGTRELIFSGLPWLAIYRVDEERVVIHRILHGAQGFPR